jgi:hypothetical protein
MDVFQVTDVFGDVIRLSDERWQHICDHHPVMEKYLLRIQSTLTAPDVIQRSATNSNEYRYYKFFQDIYGGKYVFVPVVKQEVDNFVVTAFIVRAIRGKGELIWVSQ